MSGHFNFIRILSFPKKLTRQLFTFRSLTPALNVTKVQPVNVSRGNSETYREELVVCSHRSGSGSIKVTFAQ